MSALFYALACPTTRAILELLKSGDRTSKELSKALEMKPVRVRERVIRLSHLGLIESRAAHEPRHNGRPELTWSIVGLPLAEAAAWLWSLTPTCNAEARERAA